MSAARLHTSPSTMLLARHPITAFLFRVVTRRSAIKLLCKESTLSQQQLLLWRRVKAGATMCRCPMRLVTHGKLRWSA